MTTKPGTLYLIPSQLGEQAVQESASATIAGTIAALEVFFVENIRTARRFLGHFKTAKPIQEIVFHEVNKDTTAEACLKLVEEFLCAGRDVGLLSEAGCPGIADPGSVAIHSAHLKNIPVKPLSGGSSITMALMASGLQGQQFTFLGYLPIEKESREKSLAKMAQEIQKERRSMIFIETPYRNNDLLGRLLASLPPTFWLSVSSELTEPTETTHARSIACWRQLSLLPDLHKKRCVYCVGIT